MEFINSISNIELPQQIQEFIAERNREVIFVQISNKIDFPQDGDERITAMLNKTFGEKILYRHEIQGENIDFTLKDVWSTGKRIIVLMDTPFNGTFWPTSAIRSPFFNKLNATDLIRFASLN